MAFTSSFTWSSCRPLGRLQETCKSNRILPSSSFVCQQPALVVRKQTQRKLHASKLWMMPEGPEVKTLVNQLQPAVGMRLVNICFLSGRYVTHGSPKGYTEFQKTMARAQESSSRDDDNLQIDVVKRWVAKGKFMYVILDSGKNGGTSTIISSSSSNSRATDDNNKNDDDLQRSIWITLGMSGRFASDSSKTSGQQHQQPPRWYFEFMNMTTQTTRKVFYHDPRNFGTLRFSLSKKELQFKLDSLGPDVLGTDDDLLTVDMFLEIIKKQRPQMNICKFLMDQKRISGIGNYLLAEGLYKARIDPFASLSEISEQQRRDLFHQLQTTARQSYLANGVTRSSGGSYSDFNGDRGKFEFELECYGRERASNDQPVLKDTNGPHGRTIWYTNGQLFVPLDKRLACIKLSNNNDKWDGLSQSGKIIQHPTDASSVRMGETFASIEENVSSNNQLEFPSSSKAAVESLASHLTEQTWVDALSPYMYSSPDFKRLSMLLAEEEYDRDATIFPPKHEIFAALNLCPLDEVKVVIMGQDPYVHSNQGHGLAFSVRQGVPIPPSLRNIIKEAMEDVGIRRPDSGCLESWAKQGVLLLNAVLTVQSGEANSHAGKGWEDFTDHVIQVLSNDRDNNINNNGLVFLLWGAPAAKKAAQVTNDKKHVVIKCSHPSPLSATKTNTPFLGSRCFSRANAALEELGEDTIDWNVP